VLHRFHRWSAAAIGTYVVFHLFNHLLAVRSINAHIAFMKAYREIYRFPAVEAVLLLLIAYQIVSGSYFIVRRIGQRRGFFERAQAWSGGYLAFFLLIHVGAVLYGRLVYKLDTNFYYAAAGLNIAPFQFFFVPYYFLAVVAFFTHIGCAVHWFTRKRVTEPARNKMGYATILFGVTLSTLIVSAFMGAFYGVHIPAEYQATFQ
jgi:hypothetical protein